MSPWKVAIAAAAVCGTALTLLVACAWPATADATLDPVTGWAIAPSVALIVLCIGALAVLGVLAVIRVIASFRRAHATIAAARADVARPLTDTPKGPQ